MFLLSLDVPERPMVPEVLKSSASTETMYHLLVRGSRHMPLKKIVHRV